MRPTKTKPSVDTGHPVVVLAKLSRRQDCAEIGLSVEVISSAPEDCLRGGAEPGVTRIIETPGRGVVGDNDAQGGLAHLPGQLSAKPWVDNRSSVDQGQRRHEGKSRMKRIAQSLIALFAIGFLVVGWAPPEIGKKQVAGFEVGITIQKSLPFSVLPEKFPEFVVPIKGRFLTCLEVSGGSASTDVRAGVIVGRNGRNAFSLFLGPLPVANGSIECAKKKKCGMLK